jgi:hypothetical protein
VIRSSLVAAGALALALPLDGCGGRTGLETVQLARDASALDSSTGDAPPPVDAEPVDAPPRVDVDLVDAPPPEDAPEVGDAGICCYDSQNTDAPPDDNCEGTTIAWKYVPSCDIAVAGIELHTTADKVAILSTVGGRPGEPLFSGALPATAKAAWIGADVSPPLLLKAGVEYWIEESPGVCSIATHGREYTYYGNFGTSWDGPYKSHAWTSHIVGACH